MSTFLNTITAWAATMKDKTQAKMEVQSVLTFIESLGMDITEYAAGTKKLPTLPPNLPEWATKMAVNLQSNIDMFPENLKTVIASITDDLNNAIKDLTDQIGTFHAPPADATPSQTAALANASKILLLAKDKPNNTVIQEMATMEKENVGYINKIGAEAVEAYKKEQGIDK